MICDIGQRAQRHKQIKMACVDAARGFVSGDQRRVQRSIIRRIDVLQQRSCDVKQAKSIAAVVEVNETQVAIVNHDVCGHKIGVDQTAIKVGRDVLQCRARLITEPNEQVAVGFGQGGVVPKPVPYWRFAQQPIDVPGASGESRVRLPSI